MKKAILLLAALILCLPACTKREMLPEEEVLVMECVCDSFSYEKVVASYSLPETFWVKYDTCLLDSIYENDDWQTEIDWSSPKAWIFRKLFGCEIQEFNMENWDPGCQNCIERTVKLTRLDGSQYDTIIKVDACRAGGFNDLYLPSEAGDAFYQERADKVAHFMSSYTEPEWYNQFLLRYACFD